MKNKLSILIFALFLVIGVSGVSAYDIEISPGGAQDVSGQSTIFFDIVFNPDAGGNIFDTYTFDIGYDSGELTWNSLSTILSPPSPLAKMSDPYELTAGLIEDFNGYTSGTPPTLTSPTTLATVAFDVSADNSPDGLADVWFDNSSGFVEFTIDRSRVTLDGNGGSAIMTISGISPDVYVLPEPISTILFLTGGATLGVRSYWRKRKQRV